MAGDVLVYLFSAEETLLFPVKSDVYFCNLAGALLGTAEHYLPRIVTGYSASRCALGQLSSLLTTQPDSDETHL